MFRFVGLIKEVIDKRQDENKDFEWVVGTFPAVVVCVGLVISLFGLIRNIINKGYSDQIALIKQYGFGVIENYEFEKEGISLIIFHPASIALVTILLVAYLFGYSPKSILKRIVDTLYCIGFYFSAIPIMTYCLINILLFVVWAVIILLFIVVFIILILGSGGDPWIPDSDIAASFRVDPDQIRRLFR